VQFPVTFKVPVLLFNAALLDATPPPPVQFPVIFRVPVLLFNAATALPAEPIDPPKQSPVMCRVPVDKFATAAELTADPAPVQSPTIHACAGADPLNRTT
jgi:hypothetical protein